MSKEQVILKEKLASLGRRAPVELQTGSTISRLVETMQFTGADCVVVMNGETMVGIVSERDLMMKVLAVKGPMSAPVDSIMTANPRTLELNDSFEQAVHLMNELHCRHIPLVGRKGGRISGLVTIRDIVNYLAQYFPNEVHNLPPILHQEMHQAEGG